MDTPALDPRYVRVLRVLYTRLEGGAFDWVVTASFGMALRGLPVPYHDIDLETDRAGAYEIERRCAEFVVRPVVYSESGQFRSHFGALEIEGVQVEIMGDLQIRRADGGWGEPSDLRAITEFVWVEGMRVPVPSLASEYEAYCKLGRLDKVNLLKAWVDASER